jgi:hypothetical protein
MDFSTTLPATSQDIDSTLADAEVAKSIKFSVDTTSASVSTKA